MVDTKLSQIASGGAINTGTDTVVAVRNGTTDVLVTPTNGTVTTASVVSANGFAGTVATATSTPAITLSTSVTGVLKGNGTAISAATAGTDYQAPITLTTTGSSGAATFVSNTLNIPQYSGGGGGTPGGSSGQVQGNSSGSFAGIPNSNINFTTGATQLQTAVVAVSGTTKTLALTDANTIQDCNNASSQIVTIPLNASVAFPIATVIQLEQNGAGSLSVAGASGVTLNGISAGVVTAGGQYSSVYIRQESTDVWYLESSGGVSGTSTILGSSASVTSPSISGDTTTGLYTAGAGLVDIAVSGVKVSEWASTGQTITGRGTVVSNSATALAVGLNGATSPSFAVDNSTVNQAAGITVKGAVTAGTTTITATDSNANSGLTISSKGSGVLTLAGGAVTLSVAGARIAANALGQIVFTPFAIAGGATSGMLYTGAAETALTASTEVPSVKYNISAAHRQHATGALATQRDFLITGASDDFVAASTLTNGATLGIVLKNAGTNATLTNSSGLYIPTSVLTGTITNSYGINIEAATGASNNYAANLNGNTLVGGTLAVTGAISGPGTGLTGTAASLTSGITNALASATTTVNVSSATAPTNGQVLTATSGTAATWQTPSAGGGGLTFNNVTGTTQAMAVNNGYIANNATLVTATLPSAAAIGAVVAIVGFGAGGWKIAQNAGQTIHQSFGKSSTTGVTGSFASTNLYDAAELICVATNTDWVVRTSSGNLTIV